KLGVHRAASCRRLTRSFVTRSAAMNTLPIVLLFVSVWGAAAGPAGAQVRIAGAITGTVTDSAGLVVPGATAQLKDERTGIGKQTVTNQSGSFTFPDLNFGSYEVTVTLQGFRTAVVRNVIVESARTTDLRIPLEIG